jgi:hypothetical protein
MIADAVLYPTRESATETPPLLRSEAARLDLIAGSFEEAGNTRKSRDIRALADVFREAAGDFQESTALARAAIDAALLLKEATRGIKC